MPGCLCPECELNQVPGINTRGVAPYGAEHPDLYLLGEAPGGTEDMTGIPFSGKSGELLHEILRRIGIPENRVRINNTVRCAPLRPNAAKIGHPKKAHITNCWPSVVADILASQPKVIVSLGAIATKTLLKIRASISSIRGTTQHPVIGGREFIAVPCFHPAAVLHAERDDTILTFIFQDLTMAWKISQVEAGSRLDEKPQRDYRLLTTIQEVRDYVGVLSSHLAQPNSYMTADFETGGLEQYDESQSVLGLAMSHKANQAVFVPMDHFQSPLAGRLSELGQVLAPLADFPVANQNIKFDYHWFRRRLGITLNKMVFDPMGANHCLHTGTMRNDLETMGTLYLGEPAWSYKLEDKVDRAKQYIKQEIRAAKKAKDQVALAHWKHWWDLADMGPGYSVAPLEDLYQYACTDADVTWRLVPLLARKLHEANLMEVYQQYYLAPLPVFAEMEHDGVAVDLQASHRFQEELPKKKDEIATSINKTKYATRMKELAQKTDSINIGSPVQVASLLYDSMCLPLCTVKGAKPRTTEAKHLERLIGSAKRQRRKGVTKILEGIKEWRTTDKYLSSYVNSIIHFADSESLIHPTWNISGTDTGRMSCQDPPVHSMPVKGGLRGQVVSRWADEGGCVFGADESQIEVRIFASLTEDRYLVDFYNRGGGDMHRWLASLLYDIPIEQVTADQRQKAKTCLFASLYGGGPENLAGQTGMPMKEAREVHAKFLSLIAIDRFKNLKIAEFRQFGWVSTPLGRQRKLREGRTAGQWQHAVRQMLNTPIQSLASDVVQQAIVRAYYYMQRMGLRSKIVLFHHDAIYWDCAPGELFSLLALAKHVLVTEPMKMYNWLKVPLKIGTGFGRSWADQIKTESFEDNSLVLKFRAEEGEESCYERYNKEVTSQFEGPLGRVLSLQNIQVDPKEVVAIVTPRAV